MGDARRARLGRREEYAEATRKAILDAARVLFCKQGYFSTRVDDIASLARVSPATVYAVAGGKQGLLDTLSEIWTTDSIISTTIETIEATSDAAAILRLVAAACRNMREEFEDIMRMLIATAPHDKGVAARLAVATATYRQAFAPIADRLATLGALRAGMGAAQAVDILWFFFGYSGLFTLHDDNGWTYERAERWLCDRAQQALLRDEADMRGADGAPR